MSDYPTTPTAERKVSHEDGMAIIDPAHLELIRQESASIRAQASMLEQMCRGSMGNGRAGISHGSLEQAHARLKDTRTHLCKLVQLMPAAPVKP